MGDTILRVDDIQKFYGNKGNLTKAIDHISFSVRKGEFLGIMGASGSGKTTLLNCISTIDTVTSGHIYVEEKDITALHGAQLADFRGKKLGFIFQNFNLLDTLTAYENISLALSIAGAKPSEIEQRIPQIAQALNIQDVLGKYPYQMSGGQQQRVAAARAMVTNPAIVLADEPTGALDSNSSRMLLTMLTELNERLSATILMVTHDAFSASYCNRILFIKDGQVFNELHRGTDTRKEFFTKILEVVSVLGGEQSEHICFFIWKKPTGLPMRKRLITPSGLWRMKTSTIPSGTISIPLCGTGQSESASACGTFWGLTQTITPMKR